MTNEQYLIVSYFCVAAISVVIGFAAYLWLRAPFYGIAAALPWKAFRDLLARLFPVGILLPAFLGFFWFSLHQYPGQVSFLAFSRQRPVWSSVWTALFLALTVMYGQSLVRSVLGVFPLDVASELLAIYLLLCCRSSLMYSRVGIPRHEIIPPHA